MRTRWTPTHCITFTPVFGARQVWHVMISSVDHGGVLWAPTHGEWLSRTVPAWTVTAAGCWLWRGSPTPKGMPGAVEIEETSGAYPAVPTAHREARAAQAHGIDGREAAEG